MVVPVTVCQNVVFRAKLTGGKSKATWPVRCLCCHLVLSVQTTSLALLRRSVPATVVELSGVRALTSFLQVGPNNLLPSAGSIHRHVKGTIFLQSFKDSSFPDFYSACEVTFGHVNRFCYLLTYLLRVPQYTVINPAFSKALLMKRTTSAAYIKPSHCIFECRLRQVFQPLASCSHTFVSVTKHHKLEARGVNRHTVQRTAPCPWCCSFGRGPQNRRSAPSHGPRAPERLYVSPPLFWAVWQLQHVSYEFIWIRRIRVYSYLNVHYCVLFSSRVRVRIMVRIRFSVWLVSCYAHIFVQL